jgi:hypothetical protein
MPRIIGDRKYLIVYASATRQILELSCNSNGFMIFAGLGPRFNLKALKVLGVKGRGDGIKKCYNMSQVILFLSGFQAEFFYFFQKGLSINPKELGCLATIPFGLF